MMYCCTGEDALGYLIVAVDNKVVRVNLENVFVDPEILYEDPKETVLVTGECILTVVFSYHLLAAFEQLGIKFLTLFINYRI